jgi:hypothetical protein
LSNRFSVLENKNKAEFLPGNESDGHMYVADLIPFLRASADKWYLSLFAENARHMHKRNMWDLATMQMFSTAEVDIGDKRCEDDEYNLSDEPTATRELILTEKN